MAQPTAERPVYPPDDQLLGPAEPALLSDMELQAAQDALAKSQDLRSAPPEALTQLRNHAAAYVMAHFPNATYPQPDQEHKAIPTDGALAHIAKTWPTVSNGVASAHVPPIRFPKNLPSHHPRQMARRQAVSGAQNQADWTARREAAARFLEEYRNTGTVPPSPLVRNPDDDAQLIAREGWQDFRKYRDRPELMPPPDTSQPAIPARWANEQSPNAMLAAKEYDRIVKTLSRKKAHHPPELIPPHADRIVAERQGPQSPEVLDRQREKMLQNFSEKTTTIRSLRNGREKPEWITGSIEAAEMIFGHIRDLSNTYLAPDARKLIHAATALVQPLTVIVADREAREEIGSSPNSRQAEQRNRKVLGKAAGRLSKLAGNPPHHPHPKVAEYWTTIKDLTVRLLANIDRYQLPEHEAPYEIEDLQAVTRTPLAELAKRAVRTCRQPGVSHDEIVMLVPDQWVVSVTGWPRHPHREPRIDFEHVSQRFPEKSLTQAAACLDRYEADRQAELRELPAKLDNPPPEETAFWEWAEQTGVAMAYALVTGAGEGPFPSPARPLFRALLAGTDQPALDGEITGKMRQELVKAVRRAYRHAGQRRWNKAVADLRSALAVTDPGTVGKHSAAAMDRRARYFEQSQTISALIQSIQPLAEKEKRQAEQSGTAWQVLPPEKRAQLQLAM